MAAPKPAASDPALWTYKTTPGDAEPVRVETSPVSDAPDPYRDNPLLGKVTELEDQLKTAQKRVESLEKTLADSDRTWSDRVARQIRQYEEHIAEMKHRTLSRLAARAFLWFLFVPMWLVLGATCVALPFWMYFAKHVPVECFWLVPLGLVLLGLCLVYLHDGADSD